MRRRPASGGTSANSAGWETAKTTPKSAVSASTSAVALAKPSTAATTAPSTETRGQEAGRLDPIDQQTGVTGDRDGGAEEADPQPGHREPGVGRLLDVEPERHDRDPVAERREADRARDEAEVPVPEQAPPPHGAQYCGAT